MVLNHLLNSSCVGSAVSIRRLDLVVFVLWELVYPQSLSVVRQYLTLKFSTPATSH